MFAQNLQYYRRRAGLTQEELAGRMEVSRQAVSKWESGAANPEMDKLAMLAEVLGCTLDDLLCRPLPVSEQTDGKAEEERSREVFACYRQTRRGLALGIASGTGLVLLGVSLMLMLCLRWEFLSVVTLMLFLAAAVFLFIFWGIRADDFQKRHPQVEDWFTEEERMGIRRRFQIGLPCAVGGILCDVALLIALAAVHGGDDISDADGGWIVGLFLMILALLVPVIIYVAMELETCNLEAQKKPANELGEKLSGVIMMTATILFLIGGFCLQGWHIWWVVFPVGGILCGIVNVLTDRTKRE